MRKKLLSLLSFPRRRESILCLLSIVFLLSLFPGCKSEPQSTPAPPPAPATEEHSDAPNVLLITLDAVRADRLGCYGYSAADTPALDSLAASGVRFAHAFAQSPLTLPSHATMFTGLYPEETSLIENGLHVLPPDITTLAEVCKEKGFATAAFIGSAYLDAYYGLEQGFDLYDDVFNNPQFVPENRLVRPAQQVVDAALDWLNQRSGPSPFFCWVNLADARKVDDLAPSPDPSLQKEYDRQLTAIDAQISRLLDSLRKSNALDNTLVVVAGANGESLLDHSERGRGLFLYSSTLHVPLVFSFPSRFPPGRTVTTNVRLLDIFPTIRGFEGWADSKRVMDTSQAELLLGPQSLLAALLGQEIASLTSYARTDYPARKFNWSPLRSLTAQGLHYIDAPTPELYDLLADPSQSVNLAPTQTERLDQMRSLLTRLQSRLNVRAPARPKLSQESLRILESLPDTSKSSSSDFTAAPEHRPDPKDMLKAYNDYLAGSYLLDRRDYPQALRFLTAALDASPDSPAILAALAELDQQQDRLQEAYDGLRLALALNSEDPDLLSQMVSLMTFLGQFHQAVNYARLTLEIKNLQPRVHNDLGILFFSQNHIPIALKALKRALEIRPNYADAHFNLAVVLANDGREKDALTHFRLATEAMPNFTEAYFQLARHLGDQQRYSEAAQSLAKVLELDPTRLDARYMLANVFSLQNKFEESIAHYNKALEGLSQHAAYQHLHAYILQDLGADLFRDGQVSAAAEKLTQAVLINPDLPGAHYWLAQTLSAQNQNTQAIDHYRQALRLRSVFPEAASPLGRLTLEEARRLTEKREFAQAVKLLTDVRRIIPRDLDLTNALARLFATCPDQSLRRGRMAVRLAQQTVTATGSNKPEYLDTLAAAYAETGEFDKALTAAEKALNTANVMGLRELTIQITGRIDLYKASLPYREPPE